MDFEMDSDVVEGRIERCGDHFVLSFLQEANLEQEEYVRFSQSELLDAVLTYDGHGEDYYYFVGALKAIQYIYKSLGIPNTVSHFGVDDALKGAVSQHFWAFIEDYEARNGRLPFSFSAPDYN